MEFIRPQLSNGVLGDGCFTVTNLEYQDNNKWKAINSENRGRIYFENIGNQVKYKGIRSIKYIKLYLNDKLVFKRFIRNKKFYNNKTAIKLPKNLSIDKSLFLIRLEAIKKEV